jgi:hypothetical protein
MIGLAISNFTAAKSEVEEQYYQMPPLNMILIHFHPFSNLKKYLRKMHHNTIFASHSWSSK